MRWSLHEAAAASVLVIAAIVAVMMAGSRKAPPPEPPALSTVTCHWDSGQIETFYEVEVRPGQAPAYILYRPGWKARVPVSSCKVEEGE